MRITVRCKNAMVLKSDSEEDLAVVMEGVNEGDIDCAKELFQNERMWELEELDKLELPEDFRIK